MVNRSKNHIGRGEKTEKAGGELKENQLATRLIKSKQTASGKRLISFRVTNVG